MLGPLLFNIYLNDLFLLLNDIEITNYADDTTLYACDDNLERVLQKLEVNSELAKANRKLTILGRMSNYLSENKKKILYKAFFESQFKYCPLVWMCHSRQANARINRLHERALRIVYDDHYSSFEELLIKDGSVKIHISNIQTLAIELYKIFNGHANDKFQELY